MDIDENAGVSRTVRAWDRDTSRELASLAAGNPDLLIVEENSQYGLWKHDAQRLFEN